MDQRQAAQQAMIAWLADEHELGKAPGKIECAGEFDLHGMRYYLFKFKRDPLGKWLLGVCGGYEPGANAHCGHVYSDMEEYSPATAREKAAEMVERIRAYWMQKAREQEQDRPPEDAGEPEEAGNFVGFVLLSSPRWDPDEMLRNLQTEWETSCEAIPDESGREDGQGFSRIVSADGMMLALSLMPAPVPDGEAEQNAANNYLWPQAVEVTRTHQAHILVAVLSRGKKPVESGRLFVKACAAALRQENALGVYASGTVFQPEFYLQAAALMKEDALPIFNWVYFGLYEDDAGMNGYTYGMTAFGKREMEVVGSKASAQEVRNFLFDLANYVLEGDVVLREGETIGFSQEQKLPITLSPGAGVDGLSLKIGF